MIYTIYILCKFAKKYLAMASSDLEKKRAQNLKMNNEFLKACGKTLFSYFEQLNTKRII